MENQKALKICNSVVSILAIVLGVYSIIYALFPHNPIAARSFHIALAFPIGIICKGVLESKKTGRVRSALWTAFAALALVAGLYIATNARALTMERQGLYNQWDYVFGAIVVVATIVLTWKYYGTALTCVVGFFLAYLYFGQFLPAAVGHPGVRLPRIISTLSLYTDGIMGSALGAVVQTVAAVLIFAGFLEASGGTKVFMDLSMALCGRFSGGAAKVAVVASSLFGMISGSAAANVAGTGVITIPMMKKTGFEPHYAGAIEAAVSSGGQIMPPIMGAAAFIIAEMLGVGYTDVMKAAIMPALLYYVAIFMAVHLYAKKNRITGIPKEAEDELPSVGYLLKKGGYLLLPLLLLLVLVVFFKKSPQYAALWSTLAIIALSWLRKDTRITPRKAMEAMKSAALGIVPISIVCCAAGVVMGVFTVTGLGLKISAYIVNLANGNLFVLCLLAFLCSILLGMGLPTVACYMLLAILVAPAMIEFGVYPMAAHMFVFYFGIVSAITPPVAIAAFVGAGIAKAKPMQVGFTACTIALPAFFVPFIFVYQPALLFYGTPLEVIQVCFTSTLGALLCAVATQGYFFSKLKGWERILAGLSAIAMLIPETITDFIGIAGLILVFILSTLRARRQKEVNAAQ